VSNNGEKADLDLHEIDLDDPLLVPPDAIAEPVIDPLTEYLDRTAIVTHRLHLSRLT
jgi:hypothetical protein